MKKPIILTLLLVAALAYADQEQTSPAKTTFKLNGGVQTAYNFDYQAFGIKNYLREIGFWTELFSADNGLPQQNPDSNSDVPQLLINVKNVKLVVKTFSNKELNNNGVELQPNFTGNTMGALAIDTKGNSIDVALTWKGFWISILSSVDGYVDWGGSSNVFTAKRGGFDYTDSRTLPNAGIYTNEGLFKYSGTTKSLLSTAGLFVPDSSQWENSPDNFALGATYYTYDKTGSEKQTVLTNTSFEVSPYSTTTLSKGILRFGYEAGPVAFDAGLATKNAGSSLFSTSSELNTQNAVNFQLNGLYTFDSSLAVRVSALGGTNYTNADGGDPWGVGGMLAYSWNLVDSLYLVPVAGASFQTKFNGTTYQYTNAYMATGGIKFLWGGEAPAGKNSFSSMETFRGLSVVSNVDDQQQVNVQAALFDPSSASNVIPQLGTQAFFELKNVTGVPSVDTGKSLWGFGAKLNYFVPAAKLNVYGYGHYKYNDTTANAGQTIVRAGFEYTGIKSMVLDVYYLMGRLTTLSNNLGNVVCDLRFVY